MAAVVQVYYNAGFDSLPLHCVIKDAFFHLRFTMSYEESVLECADEYGCLTLKDAKRLFNEHGSDYWEAHNEGMPITLNAEKLLDWLGY